MSSAQAPAPLAGSWPIRPITISTETACYVATAAFVVLLCLARGGTLLNDPDTQWHVAAGLWMIENSAVPRTDVLSYTFTGQPWIAKEWLSQLLMTGAYLLGGWPMVASLAAIAIALTASLAMWHMTDRGGLVAGFSMAFVLLIGTAITAVARPHVLVFPIIVAWTICLVRSAETTRRPPWMALPLLALWANMHAGFTIGLIIAAAFGLEALLRSEASERVATALRWLGFGLACLAMGIATPYGAEPMLLNATMASGNEAIQYIMEWRAMSADSRAAIMLSSAALSIYALSRQPYENAARLLLLALLTFMMIRHERFMMYFGLVAPIIAGPLMWQVVKDACRRLEIFQTDMHLPPGVTPRRAAAALGVVAIGTVLFNTISLPTSVAPSAALAAVPTDLRKERVFNSYNLGGFLAKNGIKTFIDGRTDQLFLGGFMTRFIEASRAPEPALLQQLLDQYEVQWALILSDAREAAVFPQLEGWRALHTDDVAQVWVREPR